MTHAIPMSFHLKKKLLSLTIGAALVASVTSVSARPEGPQQKRIFYKTATDSRVVVVEGDIFPQANVVNISFNCRTNSGAAAVIDIGGKKFGNRPCDGKIHSIPGVAVESGERIPVTMGMQSGGTATLSIWSPIISSPKPPKSPK
jgi:hypothetical protein